MAFQHKNNGASKLAGSLTAGAVTLSVQTGEGSRFPLAGGADWFPLTILKADGTFEIVKCTSRTGDVFTIVRAQESTSALAFNAGDRVELRLTSAALDDFLQGSEVGTAAFAALTTSATDTTAGRVWRTDDLVKTTSATDTTAGRVLKVGDFGLGGTSGNDVTDANLAVRNGFYRLMSPYTNSPDGVSAVDMVVNCWGANVTQRACRSGSPDGINYVRSYNGNTYSWGAWKTEWDTGNLVPTDTTRIDVASAATINLTTSAPNTRHINITGTTGITAFTVAAGQCYFVRFNAALTLTNNANIVTQAGANIKTAAGDTCILRATAANTVEVLAYTPFAYPFLRPYESAEQTITAGGTLTIAHGLGASPKLFQARIICKTADIGYSIGDEVFIANEGSSSVGDSYSASFSYNGTTNIDVRYGSGGGFRIPNKGTGGGTNITAANWRLIVRAWA